MTLQRNYPRLLQSFKLLIQSNRSNGNVSFMLNITNPMSLEALDLKTFAGYAVGYSSNLKQVYTKVMNGFMENSLLSKSPNLPWDTSIVSMLRVSLYSQYCCKTSY